MTDATPGAASGGATETRTVVMEREMPHPPEKVWRALTTPALMEDWLMKNDFEPRVGHQFAFRMEPSPAPNWDGVVLAEVLEVDKPRRLSYTWGAFSLASTVTWILTPTATGTHVRMEHAGFGPDNENAYRGATAGWTRFIGQLEELLARTK
jgi:uncharacterized protein YndB with AHSA1/START domain